MTHNGVPRYLKASAIVGAAFALFLLLLNHDLGSYVGPLMPKKALLLLPKIQNAHTYTVPSPSASPSTPTSFEEEGVARRFQEREEFKKEMCREMNTSGKILTNYFMYYNKEYKLLLCAPPKTGCSSLKRHLLRLVGFPENINVHSDQARRAIAVSMAALVEVLFAEIVCAQTSANNVTGGVQLATMVATLVTNVNLVYNLPNTVVA